MMQAALSKTVADATAGAVVFTMRADSEVFVSQPRIKRTATLDGGVVIDHQGYVIGDRTIDIRAAITEAQATEIWAMFKVNNYLILHTPDGSFYGVISDLKIDRGDMRLTFLVKEAA